MKFVVPEWLKWGRLRPIAIEFVTIVAGVLVALAVDAWRTSRKQHALELQYVSRLRADLQRDTARFAEFERVALAAKAATLRALLQAAGEVPALGSPSSAMDALGYSQYIALPEAQSTVFHEMETTGNLILLRDPGLRTGFAYHYAMHNLLAGILAQPIGTYRRLIAETLPGTLTHDWWVGQNTVDSIALNRGLRSLLRAPGFRQAVNAELSYTGAMHFWLRQSRLRADSLLVRLNTVYPP